MIDRLSRAKEQGSFLFVGIWDDEMTRYYRGSHYPLQTVQERILMALGCRQVDEVIIGAPYILTDDLLTSLNVTKVVHIHSEDDTVLPEYAHIDPYKVARDKNMLVELPRNPAELTVVQIAQRVLDNEELFRIKLKKKSFSEMKY